MSPTPKKPDYLLTQDQAEELIRFLEEKRVWGRVVKIVIALFVGGCGLLTYMGVTRNFWVSLLKEILK